MELIEDNAAEGTSKRERRNELKKFNQIFTSTDYHN